MVPARSETYIAKQKESSKPNISSHLVDPSWKPQQKQNENENDFKSQNFQAEDRILVWGQGKNKTNKYY